MTGHRSASMAVGIVGTCSSAMMFYFCITLCRVRSRRRNRNEELFLTDQAFWICFADLCWSLCWSATGLFRVLHPNWHWNTETASWMCLFEGVILEWAGSFTILWYIFISVSVFVMLLKGINPILRMLRIQQIVGVILPTIGVVVPLAMHDYGPDTTDADESIECWIKYPDMQFYLFNIFIVISLICDILLLVYIACKFSSLPASIKKLLLRISIFLILSVVLYVPPIVYRLYNVIQNTGSPPKRWLGEMHNISLASLGIANVVLWGTTSTPIGPWCNQLLIVNLSSSTSSNAPLLKADVLNSNKEFGVRTFPDQRPEERESSCDLQNV